MRRRTLKSFKIFMKRVLEPKVGWSLLCLIFLHFFCFFFFLSILWESWKIASATAAEQMLRPVARGRQAQRQRDVQADRQTDRQTGIQWDRQTYNRWKVSCEKLSLQFFVSPCNFSVWDFASVCLSYLFTLFRLLRYYYYYYWHVCSLLVCACVCECLRSI